MGSQSINDHAGKRTVRDLGEFGVIKYLKQLSDETLSDKVLGIGDDCASMPLSFLDISEKSSAQLVLTTDSMVEGKHFTLAETPPFELGYKLLAVSLSDVAAMGARPKAALLTLQLRDTVELDWLEELYRGVCSLAKEYRVSIVGGDTVSGTEISLGSTVLGITEKAPVTRGGAVSGDDVWVSGEIGASALGLLLVQEKLTLEGNEAWCSSAISKHRRPTPQICLGEFLAREKFCSSMIDVSDGLLQDLGHIAEASGVAVEVNIEQVPIFSGVTLSGLSTGLAVTGGEDYELLFTARQARRQELASISEKAKDGVSFPKLSCIGRVVEQKTAAENIFIVQKGGETVSVAAWLSGFPDLKQLGFQHFRS